ncbi:MAG: ATP-dependent DNA helicase RecG [Sphingorhabdus sp.]|nr:ATP-dependent DNA helicase RecG [Sphingorhabdus sp.]
MRPDILNPLFAELTSLKGIGAALAKPLARLKLERVKDLLFHFPSYFVHRRAIEGLDDAQIGETVIVTIDVLDHRSGGSARSPLRIHAADTRGDVLSLVFFGRNSGWAKKQLPVGETRRITGKLEAYGQERQIIHPEVLEEGGAVPLVEPVYPLADGISNRRMGDLVANAMQRAPQVPEWIEPSLKAKFDWPDWRLALTAAHGPDGEAGRQRLAYDELFANQLAYLLVRAASDRRKTYPIRGDGRLVDALKMPFALTGAQARSVREIEGDLAQERPMLRLLQGDVGSGKTAVALIAMLRAVEAGRQAALLAPTEILARQHLESLRELAGSLPVQIEILTGRDKGRVRESTLMALADGSIDILVGTHAIFQEAVRYKALGLIVIDEQHRFGVSQRLLLAQKAERPPHLLAMTATPIPRTLTLALYGEMDVSLLDELPPGRTPVETVVVSDERLPQVVDGIGRHIQSGGQAYWVCPLVEESDASDLAAAEERAAMLRLRFGDKVGLVHGRMKGPEKDAVMERFASGALSLLVATTVIEVGVNVPNASLMIVEAADRFGLAQLHQLRGRVGRGSAKSTCLLLRTGQLSETSRARLALMRETNDGFRIAEEDLKLRGAGELMGTRQSGEEGFSVASEEQVRELIGYARDDARMLIERDGGLEGARGEAARIALYLFERDSAVRTLRSG